MWWSLTQQIDRGDCSELCVTDTLKIVDDAGIFGQVDLLEDGDRSRAVVLLKTLDEFVVRCRLGPHVDGVDPRKRERPVTELWDDVRLLDRGC